MNLFQQRQLPVTPNQAIHAESGSTIHHVLQHIGDLYIQGLQKLPGDYGSRIHKFLREYTGTGAKRVPFGGRDEELAKLDAWWQDEQGPAYALLVAEAGRGKTALLIQWAAQMTARKWAEVIFIPISIDFQTNDQTAVFAILAARLSELHGESWGAAEDYQLRSQNLLEKTLPEGKRLLVILDGLDEASGWRPGPHLFPPQLPPGSKLIASARVYGRTDKDGWLNQLHWHMGQAYDLTLPFLSRQGVADVLLQMGNPLDALAGELDVVSKLYYLSEEGDPLLVKLYVQLLVEQMARAPGTQEIVAWLETAEPGLPGYFEKWWRDQHRFWGDKWPLGEVATNEFFNLLAVALGPLRQADVHAMLPAIDTWRLEKVIESLGRLIIGNGRDSLFRFSHSRLGHYFYDQLSDVEKDSWEQRFVAYGEQTLNAIRAGEKGKQPPSDYMIRHYATHLGRAEAGDSAFDALVCQEWAKAWNALEGTYAGFLRNLEQVRLRLGHTNGERIRDEQEGPYISQEILCALCQASINTLAGNVPDTLLLELRKNNLWTDEQAWFYAQQKIEPEQRAGALIQLLPFVTEKNQPALAQAAFAAIQAIESEGSRTAWLGELAAYLPDQVLQVAPTIQEDNRAAVLAKLVSHRPEKVFQETRKLEQEWRRSQVLIHLSPKLPEDVRQAADEIQEPLMRAAVLVSLVPCLSNVGQHHLLEEIMQTVYKAENGWLKTGVLTDLARHLPKEVLAIAQTITDLETRAEILGSVLPHLPPTDQPAALEDLRRTVRDLESYDQQADILVKLITYLPEEALEVAQRVESGWRRSWILEQVGQYRPDEVKLIAQTLKDEGEHARILGSLVKYMPEQDRAPMLSEALHIARSIKDNRYCAETLGALATHLPVNERPQIIQEALEVALGIKDVTAQAGVAVRFALSLSASTRGSILKQALTVGTAEGNLLLMQMVINLLPNLEPVEKENILPDLLEAVERIVDEPGEKRIAKLRILANLSPYLSPDKYAELQTELMNLALTIEDENFQAEALAVLASILKEKALAVSISFKDEWNRAIVLIGLAQHLHEQTLWAAQSIQDEDARAAVLVALASYIPEPTLKVSLDLQDIDARLSVLANVIPYLPETEQSLILEEQILGVEAIIRDEKVLVTTLIDLASQLPEETSSSIIWKILLAARDIGNDEQRARVFIALLPRLPKEVQSEIARLALTASKSIANDIVYARTLAALLPYLPEVSEATVNALRAVKPKENQVPILRQMAPYLPALVFKEACLVEDWQRRSLLLAELAQVLCAQPAVDLYELWQECLPVLSQRNRSDFLSDIGELIPVIQKLGGDAAVQRSFQAIVDVSSWWP